MNTLRTAVLASLMALQWGWILPASAQTTTAAAPSMDTRTTPSTGMTEGEIRKIDKETGKLTIKHGEIKNLDMPPMTMVVAVKDAAMLDKVVLGDKVRFAVIDEDGKLVVTELHKNP